METTCTKVTEKRIRTSGNETQRKYFRTGLARGWSLRARTMWAEGERGRGRERTK